MVSFNKTFNIKMFFYLKESGDTVAKKMSELDLYDAKAYLRIDFDLDDLFIELALDSAKSYVCNYCKRPMEDLDSIAEICMAVLVLTAHFYDNRSLEADTEALNYTIGKLLGNHWFYMSDGQLGE